MFKIIFFLVLINFAIKTNAEAPLPEPGKCATSPVISDFNAGSVSISKRNFSNTPK